MEVAQIQRVSPRQELRKPGQPWAEADRPRGTASTPLPTTSSVVRVALGPSEVVLDRTRAWLERVVIGLNLCPFAKAVLLKDQIRYVVSEAREPEALRTALTSELGALNAAKPEEVDTTLLIHPFVLGDFLDYNDFLDEAEALLDELDLAGEIQIASFHPRYQFAGSAPDDIANYTNRSPYPMLHLLREASVTRALASFADPSRIFEHNMERLKALGHDGLDRLFPLGGRHSG